MTKALGALRDEERDFELRPWLFRIAHNEAISRLRQRRETVDLDAVVTLGTDSLAQSVEDRERLALLLADLRDLPERQCSALVVSGLSHEEIAGVLDSSARGVKQTIFEARVRARVSPFRDAPSASPPGAQGARRLAPARVGGRHRGWPDAPRRQRYDVRDHLAHSDVVVTRMRSTRELAVDAGPLATARASAHGASRIAAWRTGGSPRSNSTTGATRQPCRVAAL